MATYKRANAWNKGGTFDNLDLLWYAKGVGLMQSRDLDDQSSWWFFAALHGQTAVAGFPSWDSLPTPPQAPTTPLPSQSLREQYWDQCQHQSWYFPPWHRGYLIALEAQIRTAVVSLGGPSDWALPYWNYFGPDDQFRIPPAFTEQTLPDGTPNPLFVKARYGPNSDGNIFVQIGVPDGANEICQNDTDYVNKYGGPETSFWHGGNPFISGNLEQNPHNLVHGDIGGVEVKLLFSVGLEFVNELDAGQLSVELRDSFQVAGFSLSSQARLQIREAGTLWRIVDGSRDYFIVNNEGQQMLEVLDVTSGLMSDPRTAALDPVFYLHHANIDRMWAAWNTQKSNTTDANWLDGPAAVGDRQFAMPMPGGNSWVYTPNDVKSLSQLDYTYDNLTMPVLAPPSNLLAIRLMKLGTAPADAASAAGASMNLKNNAELVGANDGPLQIKSSGARARVRLDSDVRGKVFASLANVSETNSPDQVYLRLENVRGTIDAFKLKVSVNQQTVGAVALFGLTRASFEDGEHGGTGLTFEFDITDIIDNLFLANTLDVNSLDVRIEPNHAGVEVAQLTVGRVSVYRQGQQ